MPVQNQVRPETSKTLQKREIDYYPFGLAFKSSQRTGVLTNKYLYNGKELQSDLNLDWYDYGARMYDAVIGRFSTQDVLSDFGSDWTPYRYAFNNPTNIVDPDGNYEINVILSKEEKDKLREEYGKGKGYRDARNKLIESKKQGVRDMIASAKELIDNNDDVKSAFVAFSGIEEGTKDWDNLWKENRSGPTVISDGSLAKDDIVGYASWGRIGLNTHNSLGLNIVTTLHEYVHFGNDFVRKKSYEGTFDGVPGINNFGGELQRAALEEAYERASNDPNPNRRATYDDWKVGTYPNYYKKGKVIGVELGYAFEKCAFKRIYTTDQDYKEFTIKYFNKK